MADYNFYHCSRCGKITRQVELSMQELIAFREGNVLEQGFGLLNDIVGFTYLFKKCGIGRPMRCCTCGRISDRSVAGEDKGYYAG